MELAADASLAAIRARSRFGMAIDAMIRMIATTINNSISENPFCFRIYLFSLRISTRPLPWTVRPELGKETGHGMISFHLESTLRANVRNQRLAICTGLRENALQ